MKTSIFRTLLKLKKEERLTAEELETKSIGDKIAEDAGIEENLINNRIQEFIDNSGQSELTKQLYKKTLGYFVHWLTTSGRSKPGLLKDQLLKCKDVIDYRDHLRLTKRAATIDSYLVSIRVFFNWLVKEKYYDENITDTIGKERDKGAVFIRACLALEEIYKLIGIVHINPIIDKRNRTMIKLMCYTGIRCIEVNRLNHVDIIKVNDKTYLQIQRKGKKQKGGSVPLSENILKSLNEYLALRTDVMNEHTPLFISHSNKSNLTRISTVIISKIIKHYLRLIGLDSSRYTAHSLRATAAALALDAGSSVKEISYMLGHSSISQTEHYLKSIGRTLFNECTAISNIDRYEQKYRETHKKQHSLNN
ncbi:MAG: tyrosine-type recombinase/integrase [Bacteroidales bacterium]